MISLSSFDQCAIVVPSLPSWIYAITVHGTCCIFGGLPCGIILYHLLKKNGKKIVGLCVGIIAAGIILIGRPVIASYSPNNDITFLGLVFASTFGFTTFFKSMNVAFDTYPDGADTDLQTWLHWFVMTPEPTFAKGKTKKVHRTEVMLKIRDIFLKIIALFFLLTVLMQHPPPYYQVMTTTNRSFLSLNDGAANDADDNVDGSIFEWWRFLVSTHVNGFMHLWLLYLYFAFCLDVSTILNYVLSGGVRMEPGFCNPLLGSRSFKETWGIRWNRPVNLLLKRTIYIPARKSAGLQISRILVFLASGLLHEYNFSIHNNNHSLSLPSSIGGGYRPGEVTLFFLFMGILMIGESWMWNRCFPKRLQTVIDQLPSIATASILTFMVAGLAERYFLRGWFQSGFVEAVAQMMPYLKCE